MQDSLLYCLSGRCSQLIIATDDLMPRILHWGKKVDDLSGAFHASNKPVPQAELDSVAGLTLTLDQESGLFVQPSVAGHRQGLDWSTLFRLESVEESKSDTKHQLHFLAKDTRSQLLLKIYFSLDLHTDMLSTHWELVNQGQTQYQLEQLRINLVLPASTTQITSYGGRWCQEFMPHSHSLCHGILSWENRRGRTSHQTSPFWLAQTDESSETHGDCFGIHFSWSGNFCARAHKLDDASVLFQANELLSPGEIALEPGQSYQTPVLYASYGDQGVNSITRNFHQFIRRQLVQFPKTRQRPVLLNTWEGIYFDHKPDYLQKMITTAASLGVERFVIDDGWFRGRDHEKAGLGDWYVDTTKYPKGLKAIANRVKAQNMEFGLWFEPEMVNPDSELYRQHPDWVLSLSEYIAPLGRYQLVLDLQNPDVFEYLYSRLDSLISDLCIDYIKWDMNRDLVQAGHHGQAAYHGQTYALYQLLQKIRCAHPNLEIESCSSGGGRIDLAILRYCQRFWTSDCNDPVERVQIQQGFLTFIPPELMGAHIGAERSHTTGRQTDLSFNAAVALPGHLGLETDPTNLPKDKQQQIHQFIQLHKSLRDWLHHPSSQWLRLPSISDPNLCIWLILSGDRQKALLCCYQLQMQKRTFSSPVKLHYLAQNCRYKMSVLIEPTAANALMKQSVSWLGEETLISGDWLNKVGLQLPVMPPESGLLIELTAESSK